MSSASVIFCNGTNWTTVTNATTNGSCTVARGIGYDTPAGKVQLCFGGIWQVLKQDVALPFTQTASGTNHNCGIRNDKSLWCWGLQSSGRLGNGFSSAANIVNPIRIGTAQWQAISTSNASTCGIQTSGALYCWGTNSYGQIGDGTATAKNTPTLVSGGYTDWTAVASGQLHNCGIRAGLLYCWGYNDFGELGTATVTDANPTPAAVSGGFTDWQQVSVNSYSACGVRGNGTLYCWGESNLGRLGNGINDLFSPNSTPGIVSGSYSNWSQVGNGISHTCGLRGGLVYCWGVNGNGQVGDGSGVAQTTPQLVAGGYTDWTQLAVSINASCGLRSNGRIFCWGLNSSSQLGNGTTTTSTTPIEVSGGYTTWTSVAGGGDGFCAIRGGQAYCWGSGAGNRLGNGVNADAAMPTLVSGGYTDWTSVRPGWYHSCGIRSGHAYCWGRNDSGAVGDGTTTNRATPVEVSGSYTDWTYITANNNADSTASEESCGIRNGGRMYCWGSNEDGGLGTGTATATDYTTPQLVAGGYTDWTGVSMSYSSACGVRSSGAVLCWGSPREYRLGTGQDAGPKATPQLVAGGITDWVAVAGGSDFTCAVRSNGRLYCWGEGEYGQTGYGSTPTANFTPAEVSGGFTDWTLVNVSNNNSCARRSNGTLYCWGYNNTGKNGNALLVVQSTPQLVSGGYTDWTNVSPTGQTSCGIRNGGHIYCWGSTITLGDGTTAVRTTPGEISGGYGDFTQISSPGTYYNSTNGNTSHFCGVRSGNTSLYCWGANDYGELGNGTTSSSSTPTSSVNINEACTAAGAITYDASRQQLTYCDGAALRFLLP